MEFANLELSESVHRAIFDANYHTATPIQAKAIPVVLEGRDIMGCAQTGTGKTAAFALPTLTRLGDMPHFKPPNVKRDRRGRPIRGQKPHGPVRPIRSLIMAPTRELAAQIQDSFNKYGRFTNLRTSVVYGGVGQGPQVRALQAGVDILIATPGRLLDLRQQGHIDLGKVEVLILDEADQMLDMGFLPDLRKIVDAVPKNRQTLMFSATMPKEIQRLAERWLTNPEHIRVAPESTPIDLVEQSVFHVEPNKKSQLLTHFLENNEWSRALVFARTKHGADKIVKQLTRAGIKSDAIHGNKSQSARMRALARFKSEKPPVLVATDIAARGLDVSGITHVFNYELPDTPETYVHRIGRTGRAGAKGVAISFCGGAERNKLRAIERLTKRKIDVDKDHPDYRNTDKLGAAKPSGGKSYGSKPAGNQSGGRRSEGRSSEKSYGKSSDRAYSKPYAKPYAKKGDKPTGRPYEGKSPHAANKKKKKYAAAIADATDTTAPAKRYGTNKVRSNDESNSGNSGGGYSSNKPYVKKSYSYDETESGYKKRYKQRGSTLPKGAAGEPVSKPAKKKRPSGSTSGSTNGSTGSSTGGAASGSTGTRKKATVKSSGGHAVKDRPATDRPKRRKGKPSFKR